MRRLGIDVGSLSLHAVLVEGERVTDRVSFEHAGEIESGIRSVLAREGWAGFDTAGITSSMAAAAPGIIDATLATIEGARRLLPGCRNVLAMGGQSFSLVLLDEDGHYVEHAGNPPCASGTGSFLEQQAERLGVGVKELASRAGRFTGKAPRIASRCAVFAKTDITHALQEGHTLDAVAAGLCEGIARSMLDVLLKGRQLAAPVGLLGGVARNARIASSIEEILGTKVVVPDDCHLAAAIGAALLGRQASVDPGALARPAGERRALRAPLVPDLADYPSFDGFRIEERDGVECFSPREQVPADGGCYLGIDVGSTSTKAALTSPDGTFVAGFYTRTGGDPIAAVQRLLRVMAPALHAGDDGSGPPRLLGAATTGSGRAMIRQVFQADREINEITAHARAAVFLHPEVDTILEIGGQDSKFTRIRGGEVYFSTMNYVCAAGTGSFIEEQARRLGVTLGEFSRMAMSDAAPYTSDRCTVYMERDLAALLGEGWSREALAAAVLHSVRDNYLSKVVGKSALGNTIVFQGATARNRALVAAFEQRLGTTIHVSPYCHLTGAMGAALLCRDQGLGASRFLWETGPIPVTVEECRLCANRCALTVVDRHGERTGWGMKCGRDYADRRAPGRNQEGASELEKRWREAMGAVYAGPADARPARRALTAGIPRGLYALSYEPLWRSFLERLGLAVESSEQRADALEQGTASVNSDFCSPMILAHGYVKQLLDRGVDFVFSPAVSNEREGSEPDRSDFRRRRDDSAFCYYSQYLPSVVGRLTAFDTGDRLVSPLLPLREKTDEEAADILHDALAPRVPGLDREETRRAWCESARIFREAKARLAGTFERMEGRDGARSDRLRVLLLGRPYVAFDAVLNTSLPRTFEKLGASVYWQEELDLEGTPLTYARQYEERMHWHYGKLIVRAAEIAARTDNLYPVLITAFRCSPDSFLMSYVKDVVTHFGKPFLFLQLDAHASDVGYLTRIEAALESFANHRARQRAASMPAKQPAGEPVVHSRDDQLSAGDAVLMPAVDNLISRLWADAFERAGHRAVLLEPSASALSTGFRHASGGECTPLVSIVGAAIEIVRAESLDPARTFFFMPTIPFACNMPQFPVLADMAFRAEGIHGLKIGRINLMALGDTLSPVLAAKILESYIVACLLYKLAARVRPYERSRGDTDRALEASAGLVSGAVRAGMELRTPFARSVDLFRAVPRDESGGRKPRIALLGDFYVKYNPAVNEKLQVLVEDLGGELILGSMSEYAAHLLDLGARRYGEDPRSARLLRTIEGRFEKIAEDLVGDQAEPDVSECVKLLEEYGVPSGIAGETSINVGRALWYCTHRTVEAIVHVNPMFCCPGVVSASLFRKIQADFGVPIIDIFYDGAANPNRVLIPHLHYLARR